MNAKELVKYFRTHYGNGVAIHLQSKEIADCLELAIKALESIDLDRYQDAIYDVRDRADMENFEGNAWHHPDVFKHQESVDLIKAALGKEVI